MTTDEALALAWTYCAPNRSQCDFPRGFWPDVARVALEIFEAQTNDVVLDWQPTRCERGSYPEPKATVKSFKGLDLGKLEINL